jgi:AraC-like DNA-binding protein
MALVQNIIGMRVYNARYRKDNKTFFDKPDYHPPCLNSLLYVEKGRVFFEFGKSRFSADKGTLICYDSNKLVLARSDPDHPVSFYIINFDLLDINGRRVFAEEVGVPMIFKEGSLKKVKPLIMRMARLWKKKRKFTLAQCSQCGLSLLQAMQQTSAISGDSSREIFSEVDERIMTVIDFIRANYKRNYSLEVLARKACLHPKYFARLFRKTAGISPRQFQLHRKVEKAKDWMTLSGEPLLSTAQELGFSDYSHFYRVFRKITGISPGEYCRKFRTGRRR